MTSSPAPPAKTKPPRRPKAPAGAAKPAEGFACTFCGRTLTSEGNLLRHVCTRKRRFLDRDQKPVRLGYLAYQRFYARRMPGHAQPDRDHFEKSRLYTEFVRFGRWVHETDILNPRGYIEFLIETRVPIGKWTHQSVYETWARHLANSEAPSEALERNILLMQSWAMQHGEDWTEFFRKVPVTLAALWISTGRLSPWVLFTASSAPALLERFGPEQHAILQKAINPNLWKHRIELHAADVNAIRDILRSANV